MQRNKPQSETLAPERSELSEHLPRQDRRAALMRIRALWPQFVAWLVFISVCGVPLISCGAANMSDAPFRIGFASSMFTDVNENDARAAVKVWGALIAREQNIPTDPNPAILKNMDALLRSLSEKQVDAVGITLTEYVQLRRKIRFDPIFVTYNAGSMTEQYVLLAHRKGAIKTLADLGGRSLSIYTNSRAYLAPLWLDTLLVKQGHPAAAHFSGKIVQNTKLSKVVLPVFFRQVDVCLVTRSGFDTMSELNPQVGQQLVVIAESPAMVPAVLVFRADYQPSFREKLIAGLNGLNKTPAGRQVLTIFHGENIGEQPVRCLDSAVELIATHEQLVR